MPNSLRWLPRWLRLPLSWRRSSTMGMLPPDLWLKALVKAQTTPQALRKPVTELTLQLPKGTTMAEKLTELDRRMDDHAGRIQSLENRFNDFFNYVSAGMTRGNLHPPQPPDPTHDNKEEEATFICTNAPSFARNADGTPGAQVGGCGGVVTRTYRVNQERVPDHVMCPACGQVAKRAEVAAASA